MSNTGIKLKVNNVVRIPVTFDEQFCKRWFQFLTPFHTLTKKEEDVMAWILFERYRLSKVISNNALIDKVLFSTDGKKKLREECHLSLPHFQVIMSHLRSKGLIIENRVNPKFIPNITDSENFKLLLLFEFHEAPNKRDSQEVSDGGDSNQEDK